MNILQILPELNVGGVETGTLDLTKYLVRSGHKVVVVSAGGQLVKELEDSGGIHYQLPVHKKSISSIIKMIPKLCEIIIKENVDIVHARSRVPAWIAYFATRRTKTVFITTCHGYYNKHSFSKVMGWGRRVIVLSNIIARHMVDDFGVPHEKIRMIARSVDLERFKYADPSSRRKDEFNVGIIGRISPIKGHLHFIKAMAKVVRVVPSLKIWIIGDASSSHQAYKEQVEVLIRRLGLWHCTQFLGTQRNIPEILSHLDCLVLSTVTHEAFGRVIVEAQASGVPVVATEVGGVVDIIDSGRTGLLVPCADPDNMASAVLKIFKDPKLARELAEAAYQKVRDKYDVELMVKNTLDVYKDALSNFKILIIKLSSLGDVILSVPSIRAVKEKFKESYKICILVSEDCKDVFLRCPYIDELIVADFRNKNKGIRGLFRLASLLRERDFDICIDLQNNRKSHILSFLALAFRRYGYDNRKFGFLLNHRIKDEKPQISPIEHQFKILNMLGITLTDPHLELWPSEEDRGYINNLLVSGWLSSNQKIIGVNITASKRWLTKSWPKEHMIKLFEALGERDMRVVITGTEHDLGLADELVGAAKNSKLINACGKTTINQLACLIERCNVYISGDSSPLHVAACVNTPFIALFGPTDEQRHLPAAKDYIVIKKDLPCRPCYRSKCKTKKCMELITVQEVIEAIDKLLTKNS